MTAWVAAGCYQCVTLFFPVYLAINSESGTDVDFRYETPCARAAWATATLTRWGRPVGARALRAQDDAALLLGGRALRRPDQEHAHHAPDHLGELGRRDPVHGRLHRHRLCAGPVRPLRRCVRAPWLVFLSKSTRPFLTANPFPSHSFFSHPLGSGVSMFTSAVFYFSYFLTIVVSLLPDVAVAYLARQERPYDWEILQEVDVLLDGQAKAKIKASGLSRTDSSVQEEAKRILPAKSGGYGAL